MGLGNSDSFPFPFSISIHYSDIQSTVRHCSKDFSAQTENIVTSVQSLPSMPDEFRLKVKLGLRFSIGNLEVGGIFHVMS